MNIFTFPFDSEGFYARPDTSVSEERVFYVPDGIEEIVAVPFLYCKIERAGKAVKAQFARRHYSMCGYGIHFCAADICCCRSPLEKLLCNSLDNSTFISPTFNASELAFAIPSKSFDIERFSKAIETVSKFMSLRTGDILAIEMPVLQRMKKSQIKADNHGKTCGDLSAEYGDLNVQVIF